MLPNIFHLVGVAEVAQVNLPVAVLVWLMIIPMLLRVDLAGLGHVGTHWRGIERKETAEQLSARVNIRSI